MKPQSPDSLRTGSSKVATVRRRTPKTLKKSFQKDWRSAASRVSPCHSRLKAMARWRISFHDSGMGGGYHARQAKRQEIFRSEGLAFGGLARLALPFPAEGDGAVANLIPRQWHGGRLPCAASQTTGNFLRQQAGVRFTQTFRSRRQFPCPNPRFDCY